MRKITFEFIDLKVHKDWKVEYNKLTYLTQDKSLTKEELEYYALFYLTQDLAQIRSTTHFIDIGWYPDIDINGKFRLGLFPLNENNDVVWEKLIYELETKSLEELLLSIDIITSIL